MSSKVRELSVILPGYAIDRAILSDRTSNAWDVYNILKHQHWHFEILGNVQNKIKEITENGT